ncbi:MAG: hypothetical protein LBE67_10050 [Kocuria palustris]|nr:hypothetical protein [Kocuria palustris]
MKSTASSPDPAAVRGAAHELSRAAAQTAAASAAAARRGRLWRRRPGAAARARCERRGKS